MPKPVNLALLTEKPPDCFCLQDDNVPYQIGKNKINAIFMGGANCVTYGGDYPGEHTFRNNATVHITNGPTIGYTAASVFMDLVFICGGSNHFYLPRYWSGCYAHLTLPCKTVLNA